MQFTIYVFDTGIEQAAPDSPENGTASSSNPSRSGMGDLETIESIFF